MIESKWVGWDTIKEMKGYERIEHFPRSSFKDNSTVIVVPTRGQEVRNPDTGEFNRLPFLRDRIYESINNIIKPMNQKCWMKVFSGAEVGKAYTEAVRMVLQDPNLSTWKYLLCVEDDMLIPPDALIRLLEAIEVGPFDAVGALYFTRGEYNQPMIYGDAAEYSRTGVLDFKPLDPRPYLHSQSIIECNGIAQGCSLYRIQLFKDMQQAYGPNVEFFETVNDLTPEGPRAFTQDLKMCSLIKKMGRRVAVDCRVKCGHMDLYTGEVF